MKADITVRWLRNHGVRVLRKDAHGLAVRFVPHGGYVSVVEAAAALGTYPVKVYRLLSRPGGIRTKLVGGRVCVPVAELWEIKRDPSRLEDGRKRKRTPRKGKP